VSTYIPHMQPNPGRTTASANATPEAINPLLKAADTIERELICCDVFDRLTDKPVAEWSDRDKRDYRSHSTCYWGAAARALVLEQYHASFVPE
jgi:hypothetical protein